VSLACRKRGISEEQMDQLISGIQRQLETSGETEIPSKRIGEMVMEGLQGLDSVAYIRFASVYKDFAEAKDFEEFAGAVQDAAVEDGKLL
ncbi:MAG: ATP cone domain-containing protein, partial [Pseudomonadota bacterium]